MRGEIEKKGKRIKQKIRPPQRGGNKQLKNRRKANLNSESGLKKRGSGGKGGGVQITPPIRSSLRKKKGVKSIQRIRGYF